MRFSSPFPVASLFSTVLPRLVPRMAMPARPLLWMVFVRMILPVASTEGALMRMPQWFPVTWLSTIWLVVFPGPENRLIPQPTLVGVCAPLLTNRLL